MSGGFQVDKVMNLKKELHPRMNNAHHKELTSKESTFEDDLNVYRSYTLTQNGTHNNKTKVMGPPQERCTQVPRPSVRSPTNKNTNVNIGLNHYKNKPARLSPILK